MSSRGKKTVWIAVAFAVVFLLFVVSTTFQGDRVGVEVCMVFHGQRDCRKAQAKDRQQALRTAITHAPRIGHLAVGPFFSTLKRATLFLWQAVTSPSPSPKNCCAG